MICSTFRAPAKLNWYLEILGRRADGFHALETVFQTLELHDTIELTVHSSGSATTSITCDQPDVPADGRNLAVRAAELFRRRVSTVGQVSIDLRKRIPHGAGLGGGSSDAATVLRGLNHLCGNVLSAPVLAELALELGSDVPFFLTGGTAHALGRGEQVTALPDLPRTPVTVLMPDAHVPTPAVFTALTDAERGPRVARGAAWAAATPVAQMLHNRLTAAAIRGCPVVQQVLDGLAQQQVPHAMSGSGAACFALGHVRLDAAKLGLVGLRVFHTWTAARELSH